MDENFEKNFEAIFGDVKIERGSWVQDHVTGKLIPKSEYQKVDPDAPAVLGALEAFVSPVDGTVIDDRAKLRRHNAEHGVTNIQDYGDNGGKDYFERKRRGREDILNSRTAECKQERVDTIKRAMAQHGIR